MRAARMLVRGRLLAEDLMTDTVQVGVMSPGAELDEDTGEYTPVFTASYDGPARFKAANTAVGEIDAAGQLLVEQDATLSLPVSTSTMVKKDMLVRVTASLTDPGLVGTEARVKGPFASAYVTARRFSVEVTSA